MHTLHKLYIFFMHIHSKEQNAQKSIYAAEDALLSSVVVNCVYY